MLGKTVTVIIDRTLGSSHPDHPDSIYPVNYGYIQGIIAPDGEEQDAYVLGINAPVDEFTGKVKAIIHRKNDVEDKWVVTPDDYFPLKEDVKKETHFQEQYFDIEIIMQQKKPSNEGFYFVNFLQTLA